jgi:hypothetical protein
MIQLSKVCTLELRTRGHPDLSCLEEYRKTVEVDGELTWVGILSTLAAQISVLPASLSMNCRADFPNIARGPRHSWGRAIYSPQ